MSGKAVPKRVQINGARRIAVLGASSDRDHAIGAFEARADVAPAGVILLVVPNHAHPEVQLPTTPLHPNSLWSPVLRQCRMLGPRDGRP